MEKIDSRRDFQIEKQLLDTGQKSKGGVLDGRTTIRPKMERERKKKGEQLASKDPPKLVNAANFRTGRANHVVILNRIHRG